MNVSDTDQINPLESHTIGKYLQFYN